MWSNHMTRCGQWRIHFNVDSGNNLDKLILLAVMVGDWFDTVIGDV